MSASGVENGGNTDLSRPWRVAAQLAEDDVADVIYVLGLLLVLLGRLGRRGRHFPTRTQRWTGLSWHLTPTRLTARQRYDTARLCTTTNW
jgi:hypothetical protein